MRGVHWFRVERVYPVEKLIFVREFCGFLCSLGVRIRLAELVFILNCFSFGDNYYKQINGVAMGTKMRPSYANLIVGFIENKFFSNYHRPKPDLSDLYKRYIDDCVGATSSSKEELNLFINAPGSKIHLGNFRKFISFPRHQTFYQRQRPIH